VPAEDAKPGALRARRPWRRVNDRGRECPAMRSAERLGVLAIALLGTVMANSR